MQRQGPQNSPRSSTPTVPAFQWIHTGKEGHARVLNRTDTCMLCHFAWRCPSKTETTSLSLRRTSRSSACIPGGAVHLGVSSFGRAMVIGGSLWSPRTCLSPFTPWMSKTPYRRFRAGPNERVKAAAVNTSLQGWLKGSRHCSTTSRALFLVPLFLKMMPFG